MALAAFVLVAAVTAGAGVDPMGSLLGEYKRYHGLLPLAAYALLMLAALAAVARARSASVLLAGVALGGGLSAVYAVIQKLGLDWVTWQELPAGRVGGAFGQPNVLGIEVVVVGFAAAALWSDLSGWWRRLLAAGILLMLATLLLTLSRGAWVGTAAALGVLAVLWLRRIPASKTALAGVAALLALSAAILALPPAREAATRAAERVGSPTEFSEESVDERLGLWGMALEMFADRPVLGAGPDAFSTLFAEYREPDLRGYGTKNVRPESSHNFLLDIAVGQGALGLLVWGALVGSVVYVSLKAMPLADGQRRRQIGFMLAALVGYYGAVFFSYGESMTGWIPWVLMGALAGLAAAKPADVEVRGVAPSWSSRAGPASAGAAALALVAFALMLFVADWNAGSAADKARAGDIRGAVSAAESAAAWNPLQPRYLLKLGEYRQSAGLYFGHGYLRDALSAYETLNTRFEPTAFGLIQQAQARARLSFESEVDRAEVFTLLERAVALDPYNAEIRQGVAGFYEQAGEADRAAAHREALESFSP